MIDVGSEVGGYRLARRLGEGGFGVVYLGEHSDGRRGAVKVLHGRHLDDGDFRERFAREVALARQVSSFCTAQVLDADPDAQRPWIATEYVDGPTLASVVLKEGPRSGGDLYRLAVSTATALAAIHAAGVVHRDFKPENILLGRDGARVIDLGVSRVLEGGRASASATIGTPRYMAPEQVEGREVTPAIDVFAWGAVIVFAATGRDAFEAPNQAAILLRIISGEPDVSGVPETLLPLVRRCLDKDPRNRPSAREALVVLLGYTDGDPEPPRTGTGDALPGTPSRGRRGRVGAAIVPATSHAAGAPVVPPLSAAAGPAHRFGAAGVFGGAGAVHAAAGAGGSASAGAAGGGGRAEAGEGRGLVLVRGERVQVRDRAGGGVPARLGRGGRAAAFGGAETGVGAVAGAERRRPGGARPRARARRGGRGRRPADRPDGPRAAAPLPRP
ncbi:serine/threonine-protein kinase [Nocardiopsis protaetiae]|uniref:serine/threonine-protein kinase n=1 Tax=Nocardiopsis protaetiae TaxID=3382270 RepID=UPI00387AD28F